MPIGAHVSIAGRLYDAIPRATAIGCECLQIFVGSPRQWRLMSYDPADVAEFRSRREQAGLDPLVAHASYLINLASPDPPLFQRSIESLIHTVRGMDALDGLAAITHLGSAHGADWHDARDRVALALRTVLRQTSRAMVLLEGSAGGTIGGTFEQLREILDAACLGWGREANGPVSLPPGPTARARGRGDRLGVCLDTAHLFAAGWDIRTPKGVAEMVETFDRKVGLGRLRVLHFNDSKGALGSRVDRHENIGEGWIGRGGFRAVFGHPALRGLPGLIETPGFDRAGPDRRNVMILKSLRASPRPPESARRPRRTGRPSAGRPRRAGGPSAGRPRAGARRSR